MGTHSHSLYYRTARWMFTKLGRDEVLMALNVDLGVSAIPPRGGSRAGGPFLKKPLFHARRLQQPTECIAII